MFLTYFDEFSNWCVLRPKFLENVENDFTKNLWKFETSSKLVKIAPF